MGGTVETDRLINDVEVRTIEFAVLKLGLVSARSKIVVVRRDAVYRRAALENSSGLAFGAVRSVSVFLGQLISVNSRRKSCDLNNI